eukprot:Gregarina_sp_Poly_1__10911@NODE_853_length_5957_cov_31_132767_g617_i0_p2_GENE_NODE_853_length_5957_cov_31_132767_g617_i0NODE_853_length_5957_cov_31_132767_g617_i0_p2_ORF_typecomplete_len367_score36_91G_glu_transpept/PF01019_21/0_11LAX/PF15681_5/2_9e03LAX/PF15681_5/0_24Ad_Cy_reg/PF16701_5/0_3_NODE_853_length_5957_cov_31_132767_g617_i019583058
MGNKRTSRVAALSTGQPHLKQLRLADFARHRSPCAADSPDDSSCIAFSTTPQQESSGSESEDEMQRFSASKNCILCKGVKYFQCRSASEAICRFSEAQPRQPILLWYRCPCCTEWENVPPSELHDSQIKRETETPLTVPHDAPTGIELHTYVPQRINIDGASLNTLVRLIDKGISLDTAIEAARAYSLFAEAEIYANKVQLERAEYAEMAIAQNMSKELQAIQKKELQDFELAQVQQGLWQPCQDLIPAASLLWNHISCRAVFNADLLSKEWAGITTDSIFKCRANIYKWCSLAANCLKWWPNLPHNATERYLDIQMFPLLITCRLLNVYFKNLRSYEELQCAINMFSAVFRSSMEVRLVPMTSIL